ncbi:hypothetical protein KX928_14110 [Roseobacter sp. YSTF-M11]|uniref:Uncharacterized protein n=1 Tax=Roseobacter insulae TaxID=2859783 RepID=A0A9X1FWZ3_9RHOB|nr:hypothetical protein [Roseobacter insulae]MBW4708919.1 hypothetical protein [Roseobacter insulae]
MSSDPKYLSLLADLATQDPLDLDPLIFDVPQRAPASDFKAPALPPSTALWKTSEDGASHIGLRLTRRLENPSFLAARLAAIAVERQIIPVFLSHIGVSGMQRFGFRVEQMSGTTDAERAACEDQLRRFWNMAMIIDAADIEKLG